MKWSDNKNKSSLKIFISRKLLLQKQWLYKLFISKKIWDIWNWFVKWKMVLAKVLKVIWKGYSKKTPKNVEKNVNTKIFKCLFFLFDFSVVRKT